MGSPIDVGGQYPFITFFTPPRLSGKFLLIGKRRNVYHTNIDDTYVDHPTPALIMYQIHHMEE